MTRLEQAMALLESEIAVLQSENARLRALLAEPVQLIARSQRRADRRSLSKVRMSEHKATLIAFLADGVASRATILHETGIPEGSLGQLLREPEFAKKERGMWGLKKS